MIRVGIDSFASYVYECSGGHYYALWPSPIFFSSAFLPDSNSSARVETDLVMAELIFREESFDAVTRVRRGRFYSRTTDPRPSLTVVLQNPYLQGSDLTVDMIGGKPRRNLFIFEQYQIGGPASPKLVALGSSSSLWRVLNVEPISTGEILFTLKARHSLGVLPELNPDRIPQQGRSKALETYEKLADAAYRESPESVVDRARDAAQWFLATNAAKQCGDTSLLHEDLGKLLKKCDKEPGGNGQSVLNSAARIIARLHSRVKPNESVKRSLRPVMESDAEFALAAVGLILREFGWDK